MLLSVVSVYVVTTHYYYLQLYSPRVTFAGYSIPHPSLECVNVRVQTTGTTTPFSQHCYYILSLLLCKSSLFVFNQ